MPVASASACFQSGHLLCGQLDLCDLIRQATGEMATAIIRNFVMQKATACLHDGKTISETSDLLGFEYPQHFTRMFKKHYGLTPSKFLTSVW